MKTKNRSIDNGLVHIYYGEGKGKTSAALGLGMRASGCGLRVCMIQFLKKSKTPTGELKAAGQIENFRIIQLDQSHPIFEQDPASVKEMRSKLREGIALAAKTLTSGRYDVVILDEVLNAVQDSFMDEDALISLLSKKAKNTELILTGRAASDVLLRHCDYASHIKCVKHPFDKGILARRGIEY